MISASKLWRFRIDSLLYRDDNLDEVEEAYLSRCPKIVEVCCRLWKKKAFNPRTGNTMHSRLTILF